jgi:hypothetical protein
MIVTETILRSIFSQLPPYIDGNSKSFPIRYEWGNQADLLLYLAKIKGNKYPLVWLVSGSPEIVNRPAHTLTRRCRFIISKESKSVQDRNPTVWDTEFVNCLNPLLENVLKALDRSGVTTIVDTYEDFRDANYTEEDLAKATDFWNVIVLDINIRFTEKADGSQQCINTIKF